VGLVCAACTPIRTLVRGTCPARTDPNLGRTCGRCAQPGQLAVLTPERNSTAHPHNNTIYKINEPVITKVPRQSSPTMSQFAGTSQSRESLIN
jgi:hypothetical protein